MYIFYSTRQRKKKCSWTDLASNDEYKISELWVTMYNIIPGPMPIQYNSIYNLYNHRMKKKTNDYYGWFLNYFTIILMKNFDYSIQVLFDVCESQYLNTIILKLR